MLRRTRQNLGVTPRRRAGGAGAGDTGQGLACRFRAVRGRCAIGCACMVAMRQHARRLGDFSARRLGATRLTALGRRSSRGGSRAQDQQVIGRAGDGYFTASRAAQYHRGAPTVEIIGAVERLIGTSGCGAAGVGLCLDLTTTSPDGCANRPAAGAVRISGGTTNGITRRSCYKQSTSTRWRPARAWYHAPYRPSRAARKDVCIIDVPWKGFSQAVQIGRMAEDYEIKSRRTLLHTCRLHAIHCARADQVG